VEALKKARQSNEVRVVSSLGAHQGMGIESAGHDESINGCAAILMMLVALFLVGLLPSPMIGAVQVITSHCSPVLGAVRFISKRVHGFLSFVVAFAAVKALGLLPFAGDINVQSVSGQITNEYDLRKLFTALENTQSSSRLAVCFYFHEHYITILRHAVGPWMFTVIDSKVYSGEGAEGNQSGVMFDIKLPAHASSC
jgi:hypothetical protein